MASRRGRHQDDARPAPELMGVSPVARVTRARLCQPGFRSLRNSYRSGIGGRTTGGRRQPVAAAARVAPAPAQRPAAAMAGQAGCTRLGPAAATRAGGGAGCSRREVLPLPGGAGLVREAGLPKLLRRQLSQLHAPSGRGSSGAARCWLSVPRPAWSSRRDPAPSTATAPTPSKGPSPPVRRPVPSWPALPAARLVRPDLLPRLEWQGHPPARRREAFPRETAPRARIAAPNSQPSPWRGRHSAATRRRRWRHTGRASP